tara:strand:+ start:233 stop:763 length:531 start_codon:yes stop_codon:yes gene_type:complete
MSVFKLVDAKHPLLKLPLEKCSDEIDRPRIKEDLIDSMKNFKGIGLSANQIGIMERVFVMYSDVKERKIIACFNPKIVTMSDKKVLMDEGCLSYPGLWLKVSRPDGIEVSYEDESGEVHEKAMFGLECRVFQHEFDHMEGTNFTERVSGLKLKMGMKRLRKVKKRAKEYVENQPVT